MDYLINTIAGAVGGLQQPAVKAEEPMTGGAMPAKKRKMEETPVASKRSKASKEHRLEQNRIAARDSRRRKKKMLEELQRSLCFFTKANAVLRTEHEELSRKLLAAQNELNKQGLPIPAAPVKKEAPAPAVAQASPMPVPGTTMQAMASFQQAAALAMQSTAQVMQTSGVALDANEPATAK
ncbi:MAG: hypothetical protein SGARI_006470 [Bacillariaceae sp.]